MHFLFTFFTDAYKPGGVYKSGVSKQIQRQHNDDTSLLLSGKVVLTFPGNFLHIGKAIIVLLLIQINHHIPISHPGL